MLSEKNTLKEGKGMSGDFDLDKAIRKIPDFPEKGILFYDITSILSNPEAFRYCVDSVCGLYRNADITSIAAVEARGFVFAAPVAEKLGLPLILVRKKGKLPGVTVEKSFDLEYGNDTIQIQRDDVREGDRVLLLDDLVATGGTLKAAADLITECGGKVVDIFCVIGLPFLNNFKPLESYSLKTLINYDSEKV